MIHIASNDSHLKSTLKTVVLGIVVIGLLAVLTTTLLVAFNVTDPFILVVFGTVIPILIGVVILLRILDVL